MAYLAERCTQWGKNLTCPGEKQAYPVRKTVTRPEEKLKRPRDDERVRWGEPGPGCEGHGGSSASTGKMNIPGRKKNNISREENLVCLERGKKWGQMRPKWDTQNKETRGNDSPAMTGPRPVTRMAMLGERPGVVPALPERRSLCPGGLWAGRARPRWSALGRERGEVSGSGRNNGFCLNQPPVSGENCHVRPRPQPRQWQIRLTALN